MTGLEVVRDPTREPPDRLDLARVEEALFERVSLGDVDGDEEPALDVPRRPADGPFQGNAAPGDAGALPEASREANQGETRRRARRVRTEGSAPS